MTKDINKFSFNTHVSYMLLVLCTYIYTYCVYIFDKNGLYMYVCVYVITSRKFQLT